MKISVVIPAYNEENTIGTVLDSLHKLDFKPNTAEFIVVDDGSTDGTASVISSIIHSTSSGHEFQMSNFKYIKHKKNRGKGAAVVTGFEAATGDIIVIQDADLEYNPIDIPRLLQPIIDGKQKVVYGTRLKVKPVLFGKNKTPFLLHFFGNKFLSLMTTILYGESISDMETGYKLFDAKALDGIKLHSRSFDFEPEITAKILKKGIKIREMPIDTNPRGYDEGKKIRPFHDGAIALWTLVKYRFVN